MNIEIDPGAGPCFGVENAIQKAESILQVDAELYTVGDLIHNEEELERLEKMGMQTIDLDQALTGNYPHVLFRAHGEPPQSYQKTDQAQIQITDATCPIVIQLQNKIAETYQQLKGTDSQLVIFGKKNHPEVVSLQGHCEETAIIIEGVEDIGIINLSLPIHLFSQTTKYRSEYYKIKENILKLKEKAGFEPSSHFFFNDSSCKIVAKRDVQLREFIQGKDLIVFVSGSKSSNGKQLFQICKKSGIKSLFISRIEELHKEFFVGHLNIGISGATSTPKWLLDKVKAKVIEIYTSLEEH